MKSVVLKGGLGNQLFQLATFFMLRNTQNFKDIKLDCSSGFILDLKYNRNLEIFKHSKNKYSCSNFQSKLNILVLIINKFFPKLLKIFPILVISDENFDQLNNLGSLRNKFILFDGYFQNSKIVNNVFPKINSISKELLGLKSTIKFENLYEEIKKQRNSVALCVRFYEEANSALSHTNTNKGIKSASEFNKVVRHFEQNLEKPFFFIFVQNENKFTKRLIINSPHKFITHSKGYYGSWQRLKAQSFCKHHIFNNSTFYYWGAKFSSYYYKDEEFLSLKYVSDNFLYKEIYQKDWNLF